MSYLGVSCSPGERTTARVPIGEFSDGSPVLLPVALIRGRTSGPTLYVQAGIDGDEVTGVEIARRLLEQTAPGELTGTLVVIPAANLPAFLTRTRTWLLEERVGGNALDLLPGWSGGLLTERIAHTLLTEFMIPADVTLDLHAALDGCDIAPFTYVLPDHHDGTYHARVSTALAFGAPYVYRVDKSAVDFETQPLSIRSVAEGYAPGTEGNVIVIAEMGESRRVSEQYVGLGVQGIRRVMQSMGMISERAGDAVDAAREFTRVAPVHVNRGGGLRREVAIGTGVEEGQRLGLIVDMFGRPIEEIRAPTSGFVLRMMLLGNVASGAEAFWIAS